MGRPGHRFNDPRPNHICSFKPICREASTLTGFGIAILLISHPLYLRSIPPLLAQEYSAECQSSVRMVRSDIEARVGAKIAYVRFREASNSPFSDASTTIQIVIDAHQGSSSVNQKGRDLMRSTQLMTNYASRLIRECPEVVLVKFGVYGTGGDDAGWYLSESNQIRLEKCLEHPGRGGALRNLPWGTTYCW
jgi:hypothetical protein